VELHLAQHEFVPFAPLYFLPGFALAVFRGPGSWAWPAGISNAEGMGAILVEAGPAAPPGKIMDLTGWMPERLGAGIRPQLALPSGKPGLKHRRSAPGRSGIGAAGRDARDA
jgi:hypothetical protein